MPSSKEDKWPGTEKERIHITNSFRKETNPLNNNREVNSTVHKAELHLQSQIREF